MVLALPGLKVPPARPLAPLEGAMWILDQKEDELLHACEDGTLPFAWDIATPTAERRELRILSESIVAIATGKPQPVYRDMEDLVDELVPHRDMRSSELQRFFSCSSSHLSHLLRAGCLAAASVRRAESGVNAATLITRASVVAFLVSRQFSG